MREESIYEWKIHWDRKEYIREKVKRKEIICKGESEEKGNNIWGRKRIRGRKIWERKWMKEKNMWDFKVSEETFWREEENERAK